jgi:hypothetical protein
MSVDGRRIRDALARHQTFLDFTDGLCGDSLLAIFADGVEETIKAQEAPDGTPWDPLSPAYDAWKRRHFPGQPMGRLYDVMADPVQVAGFGSVAPDRATAQYGVSQLARDEASWFQEGDPNQNRPPRRFWGFTGKSKGDAKAFLESRFKRIVR